VLHAIRGDLRAFWGLWETDIAPRLDAGIPVTTKVADEWTTDNINVPRVLTELRGLTQLVKTIADAWVPKTSIETRVLFCVNLLISNLDCCKREDKANLQLFVRCIIDNARAPDDFVYPRPVD
jgi:hypothetical protein